MRTTYCCDCGSELGAHLRCQKCQALAPRLALNLNMIALLLVFVVFNFIYMWQAVPRMASWYAGQGMRLPWFTRMHIRMSNSFGQWGLGIGLLLILALLWKRPLLIRLLNDPKILPVVTWLAVALTLYALVMLFVVPI